MIVSIHQPAYLPWLGYFDRIYRSDVFIFLDIVQFQKNSFQNRNKIRTSNGSIWLTLPVITKGKLYSTPLSDIKLNNNIDWRRKHTNSISQNYSKAKNYNEVIQYFNEIYTCSWEKLVDICWRMLLDFNEMLGIKTKILKASEILETDKKKSSLVLDLCKTVGASHYISGPNGKDYLDEEEFLNENIDISYDDYIHPVYEQVYPEFIPNMAIVDVLMNVDRKNIFKNREDYDAFR